MTQISRALLLLILILYDADIIGVTAMILISVILMVFDIDIIEIIAMIFMLRYQWLYCHDTHAVCYRYHWNYCY